MVTGASNSDLIIILIDARLGVIEQTRRHSIIASLLQIPHVVVAINKMDMVAYSEEVFNTILSDYSKMAAQLDIKDVVFIPISALQGDNIVNASSSMSWYKGESLLHYLESVNVVEDIDLSTPRFPVQYVIRPQSDDLHDYRGYAGKVISGTYKKGDKVLVLPEGIESEIDTVEVHGIEVDEAYAPQSAVIQLKDDIDVNRGNMIVSVSNLPKVEQEVTAMLCWMDNIPLVAGNKYLIQLHSKVVRCVVKEINYKLDVNTLEKLSDVHQATLNDIVHVTIKTASSIVFDGYNALRVNGGAILIDETRYTTVAGCMLQ
jgi:sulfate adenylyltransferase subunit 1